jgi:hypothetical protein
MKQTMQWDELHRRLDEILPPQSEENGCMFYPEPTPMQRRKIDALVCAYNLTAPKTNRVVPPVFHNGGRRISDGPIFSYMHVLNAFDANGGSLVYEPEKGGYVVRLKLPAVREDVAVREDEREDDAAPAAREDDSDEAPV